MNLGVCYGQLGDFVKAEQWIHRAIAQFAKTEDADRLSFAYNNLGILMRHTGRLQEAKENYSKAVYLSDISGNGFVKAAALDNLGNSHALEGKTNLAIRCFRMAVRIARHCHSEKYASALTNLGFHLCLKGQTVSGYSCLRRALKARKKSGSRSGLADTIEHFGLSSLMSRQFGKAEMYFRRAAQMYRECGMRTACVRVDLYYQLVLIERGRAARLQEINTAEITSHSFEDGLYHLAQALSGKMTPNSINFLHDAERIFRDLTSLYWLARVYQAKARYYLCNDQYEKAIRNWQMAYDLFDKIKARHSCKELLREEVIMKAPADFLDRMCERLPYRILVALKDVLSERSTDEMIAKILKVALEFTGMERAVLILQGSPLQVYKSTSINEEAIREICEISQTVTNSVARGGVPFVSSSVLADDYMKSRPSIVSNRINSIVCLPLHADDRLLGYLYLDSSEGVESLVPSETMLLEIFSRIVSISLNNSLVLCQSLKQNSDLRASLGLIPDFPEIVAGSKLMMKVLSTVHRLLDNDLAVLITGETGTGKELIARVLHHCGKRKNGPFIAVNASAFAENLLESELFGHEKGSFTGATAVSKGLFEQAKNGTIFLDEIGDMPKSMQVKLLRVLQDGEFRRVGGNEVLHSNARIIVATNRDLNEMVQEQAFREDLFYRIRGVQIHLPALRERPEDIPLLASFFLRGLTISSQKKIRGFKPAAVELMNAYPWPGNVRQLRSEIARIVAMVNSEWIDITDFDEPIRNYSLPSSTSDQMEQVTLKEVEKGTIVQRLELNNWNIVQTASSLGLTRNGLYSKMRLYNIPRRPV